jgi:hypothetical protein
MGSFYPSLTVLEEAPSSRDTDISNDSASVDELDAKLLAASLSIEDVQGDDDPRLEQWVRRRKDRSRRPLRYRRWGRRWHPQ